MQFKYYLVWLLKWFKVFQKVLEAYLFLNISFFYNQFLPYLFVLQTYFWIIFVSLDYIDLLNWFPPYSCTYISHPRSANLILFALDIIHSWVIVSIRLRLRTSLRMSRRTIEPTNRPSIYSSSSFLLTAICYLMTSLSKGWCLLYPATAIAAKKEAQRR